MKNKCEVKGCNKKIYTNNICCMHYMRFRRYGNYDKPKNKREKLIENGFSYCPKCNEEKPITEFYKDNNTFSKLTIYCKKCNTEKGKLRYINNKDKHKNYQLKSGFGISLDEYNLILLNQNNKCAICGKSENGQKMMCVDHCHNTNRIRGLLCTKCNFGIGNFRDSIELLNNAISYLQKDLEKNLA